MSEKIGKGGLLRSSAVVSVMTLLSRVLGMVRDMVVASYFGSGAAADAFFIAFKIPNFLRRLFAEGAFAQAFVPVLSEYRTKRTLADVKQLVDQIKVDGIIYGYSGANYDDSASVRTAFNDVANAVEAASGQYCLATTENNPW